MVDCLWDGCERSFGTERGMSIHHTQVHDESIAYVTKDCDYCDEEFECQRDNVDQRRFCSRECKGLWRSENITGKDHWNHQENNVICDNCGDDLDRGKSEINDHNFCTRDCRSEYFRIELTCTYCGKDFTRPQSLSKDEEKQFCSQDCKYDHLSKELSENRLREDNPNWQGKYSTETVERICEECSTTFETERGEVERGRGRFCSRDCYANRLSDAYAGENHYNWKGGGEIYYGENWLTTRKEVLERDDYKCQSCGVGTDVHNEKYGYGLSVHHIVPFRQFDNSEMANETSNLITLCRDCHKTHESQQSTKQEILAD